jgi:hypothetical protein
MLEIILAHRSRSAQGRVHVIDLAVSRDSATIKHTRKQKIGAENLEAFRLQESWCFQRGERYGMAVEGDAMHDVLHPRILGIMFPKGPEASRT